MKSRVKSPAEPSEKTQVLALREKIAERVTAKPEMTRKAAKILESWLGKPSLKVQKGTKKAA